LATEEPGFACSCCNLILTMAQSVLVAKPSRCARNVVLLIVGFHTTLFEGP
jgi:hypothetical protein